MSSPWSYKPTLTGTKVVLRPFAPADVEAMGPILADPQVLALTGSVHTTDACVGEVVLNDWRREDQTISFRILIGPAGRDRGLGTQAAALMVEHAFAASDVHRVELEVYANNPRALAAYQRVGFVIEGRRREAFVFDGQRIDAITMSILRLGDDTDPISHHRNRSADRLR